MKLLRTNSKVCAMVVVAFGSGLFGFSAMAGMGLPEQKIIQAVVDTMDVDHVGVQKETVRVSSATCLNLNFAACLYDKIDEKKTSTHEHLKVAFTTDDRNESGRPIKLKCDLYLFDLTAPTYGGAYTTYNPFYSTYEDMTENFVGRYHYGMLITECSASGARVYHFRDQIFGFD